MFTRSLSHVRVVRAAQFDDRYQLGARKMLSGWCDIRHNHKEDDGQTRAARIQCENPATSSNCPVQIELNLNPVKRTFDEELLALNERKIPASEMFADHEHWTWPGRSVAETIPNRILDHLPDRCSIALFVCASCAERNPSRSL